MIIKKCSCSLNFHFLDILARLFPQKWGSSSHLFEFLNGVYALIHFHVINVESSITVIPSNSDCRLMVILSLTFSGNIQGIHGKNRFQFCSECKGRSYSSSFRNITYYCLIFVESIKLCLQMN